MTRSVSDAVVIEVHLTQTSGHMQTVRDTTRVLDMPKITVLIILPSVLCMFPYGYQRVQVLHPGDQQLRIDFSNEFLGQYDADNDWQLRILGTDERHFNLSGNLNTKKFMHWANTNPYFEFLQL